MLLAIDTASEQMSVALASATEILAEHSWRMSTIARTARSCTIWIVTGCAARRMRRAWV